MISHMISGASLTSRHTAEDARDEFSASAVLLVILLSEGIVNLEEVVPAQPLGGSRLLQD